MTHQTTKSWNKKNYLHKFHNNQSIYKFYLETIEGRGDKYKVNFITFRNITNDINKELARLVLEGNRLRLPARLGDIGIVKFKMNFNKLHLDYEHFNKTGEKRFHTNIHSDNWVGQWHWFKKYCIILNKKFYSCTFTSTNKKALSAIMQSKDGHKIFVEG